MHASKLDKTFAALADPTRRAILARLSTGDALLKDLAEPFDMTVPAVAKHLSVLEGAGLISKGRDAQKRPCHLEPESLKLAFDWLEGYRKFWEVRFDHLEKLLDEINDPK